MKSPTKLSDLIADIYQSAEDPSLWNITLRSLGIMLNGKATLSDFDEQGRWGEISYAHGIDPAWALSYQSHYYKTNFLVQRAHKSGSPGQLLIGNQVTSDHELLTSEIYNEWFRPQEMFHVAGAITSRKSGACCILGVHRAQRCRPFDAEDLDLLGLIIPHIQRARKVQDRLATSTALSSALDGIAFGVVLTSKDRRVLHANKYAEALFKKRDGLYVEGGSIFASRNGDDARLRSIIRSACSLGNQSLRAGGSMMISRPFHNRPLALLVSRTTLQGISAALLLINGLEDGVAPEVFQLVELFGFTPAEARVAKALAQGLSATEASETLGIGLATTRTHIRRLLEKTNSTRQAELTRLLLSLPTASVDFD